MKEMRKEKKFINVKVKDENLMKKTSFTCKAYACIFTTNNWGFGHLIKIQ